MAKLCNLFSSSSGNCTYISSGDDAILIDVGESCKQITTALEQHMLDINKIKGIFITHAHNDHIKGLRVLLKKTHIPVYASKETLGELILNGVFSADDKYFDIAERPNLAADLGVEYFKTSHDVDGSVGYIVTFNNGEKVAVCTDLGYVSDDVRNSLLGCKTVMIESNHDVGMLQNGPYPFELKQRILGEKGHLSNISCAKELPELVNQGTTNIILAHLSKENNTPDLARVTSQSVLLENGMVADKDYSLYVAPVHDGKIIYI